MRDSRLWRGLLLAAALSGFGCDQPPAGSGDDASATDDLGGGGDDSGATTDDGGDGGTIDNDAGCVPAVTSCSGLCGPVFDGCLGKTYQCGGCATGTVCDLPTHMCIMPQISCMDLNVQCGAAKNSCGKRLDCGTCPTGMECNPDTNTCVACQTVTCQDLGYECGSAWLGCGPTTNVTNCGSCGTGKTCNPFFNRCEPVCTPPAKATLCANAMAASGVECGAISNGCGGIVDCGGCPPGKACGVRGVANKCDPYELPPECAALGKNCGTVPSACGGTVDCGVCPTGQVCNANGVCGQPCSPLNCSSPGLAGMCGKQFADGCNGHFDCNCTSPMVCTTSAAGMAGMCMTANTCATYSATGATGAACSNAASPTFPKGDGTNLTCKCTAPGVCVSGGKVVTGGATGTCCTNTAVCGANECGTTKTNTCTGATINCACIGNNHCDNTTHLCVANSTCATYGATGKNGNPCSNGPAFANGAGTNLTCPCDAGRECVNGTMMLVTGSAMGTCCTNTNTCTPNSCNTSVTDSCTGATIMCTCGAAQFCNTTNNTCMPLNTCATYGANGNATNPCSNAPSPSFPNGAGTDLTCMCKAGAAYCQTAGMTVTGGNSGNCCMNTAACTANLCTYTDTCTGAVVNCCGANQFCDGTGHCANKSTCATYGATGGVGAPCNPNPFFDVGDGTKLACNCTTAGGFANNQCVGATTTAAGTCQCAALTCGGKCANAVASDGCGGTIDCRCTGGMVCDPQTQMCCAPFVCTGSGVAGDECGIPHASCGSTVTCQCSGFNTCGGGGVANKCGCTPDTCRGRVGVFPDGCGNPLMCTG
jgi:hypothetical protein